MSPGDSTILILRRTPRGLPRRELRLFAERLRQEVAGGRHFHCLLTDDRELRSLNRTFLGKDEPTDVLSFPEPEPGPFLGAMAISAGRASEQARERGHSLEVEIRVLMLHGLLHLTGMDHVADRGRMRRAETRWRKKLGLPSGLIERAAR
jgi:probable rRNA maturation factor